MKKSLLPLVLLAGGLATRLHPLTHTVPKSLIPIRHKPFILYQLALLYKQGIREIVICLGYLGEQIETLLRQHRPPDLSIHYVYDGDRLLDTAGAIRKILPLLDDHFFVLYGDSYLTYSYWQIQQVFLQAKTLALMTVFKNANQWDKSNVVFVQGRIMLYDKTRLLPEMQYIDYGLHVFDKRAFVHYVPPNVPYALSLLQQQLLRDEQLAAIEVPERFYEIGSFTGIRDFEAYLDAH